MDKAVVMQWVVVKDGFEIGNGGIDLHFANAYEAFSQEQDGVRKVTENGRKMVPKWSQNGPKRGTGPPKGLQKWSRKGLEAPKGTPQDPDAARRSPGGGQEAPRCDPRARSRAPRSPKMAPR